MTGVLCVICVAFAVWKQIHFTLNKCIYFKRVTPICSIYHSHHLMQSDDNKLKWKIRFNWKKCKWRPNTVQLCARLKKSWKDVGSYTLNTITRGKNSRTEIFHIWKAYRHSLMCLSWHFNLYSPIKLWYELIHYPFIRPGTNYQSYNTWQWHFIALLCRRLFISLFIFS